MSITDILIRSMSGYIFMDPVILFYFWRTTNRSRKQETFHTAAALVSGYYLIGVLTITGIGKLKSFKLILVLIPVLNIFRTNKELRKGTVSSVISSFFSSGQ